MTWNKKVELVERFEKDYGWEEFNDIERDICEALEKFDVGPFPNPQVCGPTPNGYFKIIIEYCPDLESNNETN